MHHFGLIVGLNLANQAPACIKKCLHLVYSDAGRSGYGAASRRRWVSHALCWGAAVPQLDSNLQATRARAFLCCFYAVFTGVYVVFTWFLRG